jgi:hypothetical protein
MFTPASPGVRRTSLPAVGSRVILIGTGFDRCETTVVSNPTNSPDSFALFIVKDAGGTAFWVSGIERHPCGCVTSHEWSRIAELRSFVPGEVPIHKVRLEDGQR